ncbi:MAG TPA: winged helix-turn-helix transcriptional regulator [Methylomirabilota bacterium]|nr:winged helix-turn-helix transcriptional regulator [Methylomirabilota bacterium]
MKGYGQFCPIAVACETFAERWTPLILRELLAGARRFNDIRQGVPMISRTLLGQRLRELEDAGIIDSQPLPSGRGREYRPTRAAEEFRAVLERLGEWGQRWGTTQFDPQNLDLTLLMWNVRRRIALDRLPPCRTVVRFDFRAFPERCRGFRTSWLILDRAGADVCLKDPGFDVDLVISADAEAMARVWTGAVTFEQAVRSGGLRLEGPRDLVRTFPTWLQLSHFAHVERPPRAEAGRRISAP